MVNRVGQQSGNYHLTRLLGRGGFAEVYLGQHTLVASQLAAIKILNSHLSETDLRAFQREAETIATLTHPHIVRMLDFDSTEDEGIPFLVMDYAPHGSLRRRHLRGEQVPLTTVIHYVQQIAAGLQYAHEKKIIHRDIKPDNILLNERDEIVISDFGIATIAHNTNSQSVQPALGTAPYMAPEQIQEHPRPASDQYALAIMVYEWLAGELPFTGTWTEIITRHITTPPPSLRAKNPTLLPAIEQAIMIALAKRPQERFFSVEAFAQALEQASLAESPAEVHSSETPASLVEPEQGERGEDSALLPAQATGPNLQGSPETRVLTPSAHTVSIPSSPAPAESRSLWQNPPALPTFVPIRPRPRLRGRTGREIIAWLVNSLVVLLITLVVGAFLSSLLQNLTPGSHHPVASSQYQSAPGSAAIETRNPPTPGSTSTGPQNPYIPDPAPTETYNQAVATSGIMAGFDAQHSKHNPYETILGVNNVARLVPAWQQQEFSGTFSSPMVVNGTIYVANDFNEVYAFNAAGGQQEWSTTIKPAIESSPAVANGSVYLGLGGNSFYTFDARTGHQKWPTAKASNSDIIFCCPTVADGMVYAFNNNSELVAFDEQTGRPQWSIFTGYMGQDTLLPVVVGGTLYAGGSNGSLYALDAYNGQQEWSIPVNTFGIPFYSLAGGDGIIYACAVDGMLHAIDIQARQIKWSISRTGCSTFYSLAVANGRVYVVSDGTISAFGAQTGKQIWTVSGRDIFSIPTIANGVIYVGSSSNTFYAFDGRNGHKLWSAVVDSSIGSAPAIANGVVYVISFFGTLYAFHLPG